MRKECDSCPESSESDLRWAGPGASPGQEAGSMYAETVASPGSDTARREDQSSLPFL